MPNTDTYGFKNDLPVSAVMELVALARSGELLSDYGCSLQHAGWIAGCLGARFDDHDAPDPVFSASALSTPAAEPETIDQCCDMIEAEMNASEPSPAGLVGAAVNPVIEYLAVRLIQLVFKHLF